MPNNHTGMLIYLFWTKEQGGTLISLVLLLGTREYVMCNLMGASEQADWTVFVFVLC